MLNYSDQIVDDSGYSRPVRGASVYLLKNDGTIASAFYPNPQETDDYGVFSFSAPDGNDGVYTYEARVGGVTVAKGQAIIGIPPQFVGPPGSTDISFASVSNLQQQADPDDLIAILSGKDVEGTLAWTQGDYSALIDNINYIASDEIPSNQGAWVRIQDPPAVERILAPSQTGIGMSSGMVAYMLDSLTDGAFGSNYREYLGALLRAKFGDGGPGYHGFGAGVAADTGAGFFKNDQFNYIDILTPTYGALSVDGRGLFAVGATSAAFNWSPASRWTTARIFYEAGPTMGSINWKFSTQPDSQAKLIDCASGPAGLQYIDIPYSGPDQPAIVFFNGTGNLCFYGGDFVLNAKGYRPGNFAQGGRFLKDVAAQNSARRQLWWSLLKPSLALLDGGMNDRITRTPAQHYADWSVIVTDIQTGAPNCGILMIQSLESVDAQTTYLRDYTAQKIRIAKEKGLSYVDIRRNLGYYPSAAANGLMNADGVHGSVKGNKLKAQEYAITLGLDRIGADPGFTQWASSGGDAPPPSPFGTLTAKPQISGTGGQRKELYRLGMTNGFSTGNFSFRIAAQRIGTSAVDIVEVEVALTSANIVNEAYLADGQSATPTLRVLQRNLAGDGQTVELPVNVTIVGNQASIGVTPSQNSIMNVSGKWELLNFYPVGQLVFENPTT